MSFGILREMRPTGQFHLTLWGNFSTVPLVLRFTKPSEELPEPGLISAPALGSHIWSGQVAQSVEHGTENPGVGSSILPLPTIVSTD